MIISKTDPRIKLIMLIVISTLALITRDLTRLAAILLIAVVIAVPGRSGLLALLRQWRNMLSLILSLFIIQCLFVRTGAPVLTVGSFVLIRADGLQMALMTGVRLAIITASAMIIMTSPPRDYLLALTQWQIPYEIVFMVLAAMRFIPILREEAENVLCAVQMRGTRIKKTGPIHRVKVYLRIMIPVAARAIRRSEQMSIAMESRGFRSKPERTSMRRLVFHRRDAVVLLVFALIMALVFILI